MGRPPSEHQALAPFQEAIGRTLAGERLDYQEFAVTPEEVAETQYIGYGTSPLPFPGKDAGGAIVIFRDTTEKRRFEERVWDTKFAEPYFEEARTKLKADS